MNCNHGREMYALFNNVIFLDQVMRQNWEEIMENDSDEIMKEKKNQRKFIEMIDRIHDNINDPSD